MQKIKTALSSFGMSGMVFHAPLINAHPGFELHSVLQRTKDSAGEKYPGIAIKRTFDELIEDQDIELVIVNATNDTHYPFAKAALEAGKHVVVEKPFTNTLEEGLELISLAEKKGLVLSAFQNRRWDSDFLTVKKVIESGELGRIVEFIGNFDRYRNYIQENTWKEEAGAGSGLLYNLGPHLIDQAFALFGLPEGILGDIRTIRKDSKVDDYFEIYLYYKDVKVRLHSSYLVKEPFPRFIVHGTQGSFVKYGLDPQEAALKAGKTPVLPNWGEEPPDIRGILNIDKAGETKRKTILSEKGNYILYYENVFQAIRNGEKLAVPAMESLWNVNAIELAFKSNELQKALPFDMLF